jgi:carbon-monoxide dehydrogenase medium subunit
VVEAAESADEGTSPAADDAASAEYRRHLARVWTRRAVEEALNR